MKFGDTPLSKARGAILAHSIRIGARTFKKGVVLKSGDIKYLSESGVKSLVVARLSENDLDENKAAQKLAKALKTIGLRTGRAGTGRPRHAPRGAPPRSTVSSAPHRREPGPRARSAPGRRSHAP